jgi:uncharacterized OB-fold protein
MNPSDPTLADPYVRAFPETQAFWLASAQGRLLLPHCRACGRFHWHPRAFCPFCHAGELDWTESRGEGEVYTFTVVRKPAPAYVLAYVRLAEGPMLMSNVIGCTPAAVHIGLPVVVDFRATPEGRIAPVFRPRP